MSLNIFCKLTEEAKLYQPEGYTKLPSSADITVFGFTIELGRMEKAMFHEDRDSLFILKAFSRRGSAGVEGYTVAGDYLEHKAELVLLQRVIDGALFVLEGFEGVKIAKREISGGVTARDKRILTTDEFSVNRGIECVVTDIGQYFSQYGRVADALRYPEAIESDDDPRYNSGRFNTGKYHDANLEKTKAHLFVMVAMLKDDEDRAICVIESRIDGEIYLINGEGLSMETTDLSIENNEEIQMDVSSNNHTDSYFVKPSPVYFVKEDVIEKNGKRYKLVEIKPHVGDYVKKIKFSEGGLTAPQLKIGEIGVAGEYYNDTLGVILQDGSLVYEDWEDLKVVYPTEQELSFLNSSRKIGEVKKGDIYKKLSSENDLAFYEAEKDCFLKDVKLICTFDNRADFLKS